MKHLYRVGGGLLVYVLIVQLCGFGGKKPKSEELAGGAVSPATVSGVELFPGHGSSPEEKQAYLAGIQARMERLEEMESERARRVRVSRDRAASRVKIRDTIRQDWEALVSTNRVKFDRLRKQANQASSWEVVCTICDGMSYMPCLLCEDDSGVCVKCHGAEMVAGSEYCPTCEGRGKCYLCAGSGKMFCPFCDDGMIRSDLPYPGVVPPIE